MANDKRRNHKVKKDEGIKSKKKTVTQDASPETSSSRRSSRETSSSKLAKEIPPSTRKSLRLEKNKPPDSPPIQRKSNRTQEKITTTPLKKYNRRKKHTAVGSSGTKKLVEDPASSSMKSKNDKVKKSLKMDSKEDQKEEKQSLDVGGRKRKRVTSSVDKALPRSQRKKTESGNDKDKESQDDSSQATSSSNKDVENSKSTNSGSVSVEDKGDDDDDVEERSDNTGEESTLKTSEAQCSTSNSSLTNFNVQEISDDVEEEEKEEESPNSIKFEGVPVPDDAVKEPPTDTDISMEEKQVEHIGESIENGNVTPISGTISSSKSDTTTKKTDPDVCKDVKEFWVPVQISNVQLEQYCSMLLTNSMALSSCSKSDTVGALHDILVSNRKCCDHPYIVDQSLQAALTKDLEPAKFLEVGIKASGKLQFLDLILPEMKKRELRVLILFQPLSGSGKDSTSLGDILDDYIRQRFGEDSYERVDSVVTTPSKRQAALNNFNNKEMGRFIFLLDYRACLPSIKLSSVDALIIFDSDWNPANDLRALQKIAIDTHPEKTKIFRLYTSCTLEEKILKLSEQNVTIDKGLQNVSRSTCDALLTWGATYLFSKLTEFHCANILPEEWEANDLKEEFLNLVSEKSYSGKLIVTKGKQICENGTLVEEMTGGEQPHTFWKKLLVGRDPCWKYLTLSTPRQRKRPQFYEHSLVNTNVGSDDVGRKRKKTATVTEKSEMKQVCTVVSSEGSQLSPGESISCAASCNETSFRYLLKLNIAELCRVLKLSEEVRKMVEKFLEYVIENYQVNKEPANTLQAFLISLCWIGSELLNTELDRKQTLLIAKKRLNFTCEEEETNSVYLKLTSAKDMFLLHTENQKKTNLLNEIDPHVVKVEIPDSPEDDYVTISPDTSDVPEDPNNNSNSLPIPSSDVKSPVIQPLVTPPLPTNPEIQNESTQDKDAEKVDGPLVAQQNEGPPPVIETTTTTVDDPNHAATQLWQNLFNLQESENYNRGPPRMISCTDPLQVEMEKLSELKNTVNNFYEAIKVKINSEYEKEKAELLARLIRKYEDKSQKAELAFQSKRKEIDVNFNKAAINKILADAFRSKCRDLNPFETSQMERELQHFNQFQSQHSSSTGQSSRNHQVNMGHPTLQVVHQSANLFSNSPTTARPPPPPSNNHHPITPSPPFNHHPIFPSPPTRPRPPPNITTTTTTTTANRPPPTISPITPCTTRPLPQINPLSKPPPNITTTTPSFRNPRVIGEIRAPAPHIRPFKPSTSMSPHDHASHRVMLNHHTSTTLPPSSATQPPPSQTPINHNSHPPQPPPPSQTPTNHPDRPVAPPPLSTQVPSEQQPPATSSSSSLPPMPSVSISQSGLYSSSSGRPDIMRLSAMDLLMDVNEQAGFYQNIQPTLSGKKGGDGDLVCLSDDD